MGNLRKMSAPEEGSGEKGGVQSVIRALALLEALAEREEGATLTDLAHAAGLPPSSAHRLLTTLQLRRFARFDPAQMTWQVGVRAFAVGNAFARSRDMAALSMQHMRALMRETGETVNFFMLDGDAVTCMAQVQSHQMIRAISRPGGGVEMHRSAAGKAIYAHMEEADVRAAIGRYGMRRYTENTIVTLPALLDELAAIRGAGYSVDNEEFTLGLRCVAAPVFDENGQPCAAISVAAPASRVPPARVAALARRIMDCAKAVTFEIGGDDPRPAAPRTGASPRD